MTKITRSEFIKLINYDKSHASIMARNTSPDREFHQAYILGELYSGFRSEQDIINLKTYGKK